MAARHSGLQDQIDGIAAQTDPAFTWIGRSVRPPAERPWRLGMYGGSWNPITQAHVHIAEHMRQVAGLDEVVLILSTQHSHKKIFGLPLAERLMLLAAVHQAHPQISIALVNTGYFYHWQQLFKTALPSGSELAYIMGRDVFAEMLQPPPSLGAARDVLAAEFAHRILVIPRGTRPLISLASEFNAEHPSVTWVPMPELSRWPSSTDLRAAIVAGHALPDGMAEDSRAMFTRLHAERVYIPK